MERGFGPAGAPRREPVLNAPAGVVWAILILVGVHLALGFLSHERQTPPEACRAVVNSVPGSVTKLGVAQHDWWQLSLAFIPRRYLADAPACIPTGGSHNTLVVYADPPGAAWWSFLTHQLVHADWAHVAINCAWLLAFGGAVAARIGMARFAALGLASGVAGALLFLAFRWGEPTPMAGASGAVSGLMGAAFRFFFSAIDRGGLDRFRDAPGLVPRMSLAETFRDRRIQLTIGFFLLVNALTAVGAQYITSAGGIAWEAHIGGFFFGLLAFAIFDPPAPRLDDLEAQADEALPPTVH